ncbi:MAG: hypothetical protein IPM13_08575 [Phycisphaerales bacterium]|nr:hypothetical protein [Phycisphaerales bacterium]
MLAGGGVLLLAGVELVAAGGLGAGEHAALGPDDGFGGSGGCKAGGECLVHIGVATAPALVILLDPRFAVELLPGTGGEERAQQAGREHGGERGGVGATLRGRNKRVGGHRDLGRDTAVGRP